MSLPDQHHFHTGSRAAQLDSGDPLAHLRDRFILPDRLIYLDGNSLGPLTHAARDRVATAVEDEWGRGLIASWNTANWVGLPKTIGAKIAALIGAGADDVIVTDSTSVNLFKVLAAALKARPGRCTVISERGNFPTDLYMAEGAIAFAGQEHRLHLIEAPEDLEAALSADTAVVMLTHVNYRTGRMHDMAAVTRAVHAAGALMIWDLCHSAGAVPVELTAAEADFAIGCGYKYLNGGPGAPAFLYVSPALQSETIQPLSGWFGHASPFAFDPAYAPAAGIDRYLTGTPPVLAMAALDAALDVWSEVDMTALREKSVALCEFFIEEVERRCGGSGLTLASPRNPAERGSQVSFAHDHAYPVMQALIACGVVGDFRAPDILRFGFAPLYTRFADAEAAAAELETVLKDRRWDTEQFRRRNRVT